MKKYEFIVNDKIQVHGAKLTRIRALETFDSLIGVVEAGELGGYLESESNLSHIGGCWVGKNAKVFGNASVSNLACVSDTASVFGDAIISENASVCGDAMVYDQSVVYGYARVSGFSCVCSMSRVSGNTHVENEFVSETLCSQERKMPKAVYDHEIQTIFLDAGFKIKPGKNDFSKKLYRAAYLIIDLVRSKDE